MAALPNEPKQRGKVLTGWLIFVILANAWTAFRYYLIIKDFIDHSDPSFTETLRWALPLLAVLALINIGAVILLFQWKRLGFYLFLVTSGIAFVINLILGTPLLLALVGLIGIAIFWFLLQPRWQYFN